MKAISGQTVDTKPPNCRDNYNRFLAQLLQVVNNSHKTRALILATKWRARRIWANKWIFGRALCAAIQHQYRKRHQPEHQKTNQLSRERTRHTILQTNHARSCQRGRQYTPFADLAGV